MKNVLGMEFLLLAFKGKVFENVGKPISIFKVDKGEYKIKTNNKIPHYGHTIVYIETNICPKGVSLYYKKTGYDTGEYTFNGKNGNPNGDVLYFHRTGGNTTIHDRGYGITNKDDERIYLLSLQTICNDNMEVTEYRGLIQIHPINGRWGKYFPEKTLCRECYFIFEKLFYDYRLGDNIAIYPSTLDDQRRSLVASLFPKQYEDALEYEKDLRGGNLRNPPIPSGMYKITNNSQELRKFCELELKRNHATVNGSDYFIRHTEGTVWVRNRGQGNWSEAYLINKPLISEVKIVIEQNWSSGKSMISHWEEVIDSTTVLT